MTAADTWAVEVVPHENPERPFEVHQWLLTRNGIYNLENLDLEELARDKVYEFAFIFAPLRLKGASGSPGNPIAARGRGDKPCASLSSRPSLPTPARATTFSSGCEPTAGSPAPAKLRRNCRE